MPLTLESAYALTQLRSTLKVRLLTDKYIKASELFKSYPQMPLVPDRECVDITTADAYAHAAAVTAVDAVCLLTTPRLLWKKFYALIWVAGCGLPY